MQCLNILLDNFSEAVLLETWNDEMDLVLCSAMFKKMNS